jgi:hypothetical protein
MRISPLRSITIALLVLAGCGDDGSTTGETSTTGVTTSDTTTTTGSSATTGPTSGMSGTATSSPETTSTTEPGTTEPGTTEPGTTEPGTTEPGTTEPGTSGSTGEPPVESTGEPPGESTGVPPEGCAALGPQQCMANDACMAIFGQKVNTQKMCLQKATFLECADSAGCGDALTIGCPMGTMEQYQFPDTCLPSDFEPCEGMVLDKPC